MARRPNWRTMTTQGQLATTNSGNDFFLKIVFKFLNRSEFFKVLPLWLNAPLPMLHPSITGALEVDNWCLLQCGRGNYFDCLQCPMSCFPFKFVLILENKKKTTGARSGLYGFWGNTVTPTLTSNSETMSVMWLSSLPWCNIQLLQISSWTPFEHFAVKVFIDCLSVFHKFTVNDKLLVNAHWA